MLFDENLREERRQILTDVYTGTIPKRVPICVSLGTEVYIEKAGLPLAETQWTGVGLEEAVEDVVKNIRSDTFPGDSPRPPAFSEISGNVFWRMGKNGFMQHPEATFMPVEEYDKFIEAPYDYFIETLIPRMHKNMDTTPERRALVMHMAITALNQFRMNRGMMSGKLSAKYGFFSLPPTQFAFSLNPFDFLSDELRGFTGIMSDIKRNPQKVLDATEALLPILVKFALPQQITDISATFMPCHLPTFLRTSEFEKFFYPTFSKLIHATAEAGQAFTVFCEDDWSRYLDHLQDLPQGTRFQFEYGDPKVIKEKLGKDHIINGLYPVNMLKTHTKQQCIDKAKELIDILAPGGNYYFNFDKSPLSLATTNLDNYYAVVDYVADNAYYDNAGERAFHSKHEDTIQKVRHTIPAFKSKYYQSAEDYIASNNYPIQDIVPVVAKTIEGYEDQMFKTVMDMV